MFPSRLEDITLVTQFSVSRLERFTQTLRIWDAPISLTIYLTEPSDGEILSTFITNLDDELRAAWSKLSLTLVRPSYSTSRVALIRRLRYPINELRNHALRLAPTSYLLVLDADFIPSPMMHHHLQVRVPSLMSHGSETVGSPTQSRQALVISAFALAPSVKTIPRSLATLYEMLYATNPPSAYLTDPNAGHGPSLPSLLFHTTPLTPHPSRTHLRPSLHWSYKVCYEPQWEPYYVLHRNSYPLFEERFSDQGGDKQSQTALLNAMGWEFKGGANLDDWPGKKLGRLLDQELGERERTKKEGMVEDDEEGRHFNLAAQKDQERYRYFQDFLPELERVFGGNWRWPRGCEANEVIKGNRVGRTASRLVFGL
ncbi:BZ3501_MvSof-1269-A2-R1_Chr7-1g09004 [Microbotryum saponariae]|nr:BZ3501_MvSof-1269-A2-R1_Chr7-1g09004 [Microbotryum saponariae]